MKINASAGRGGDLAKSCSTITLRAEVNRERDAAHLAALAAALELLRCIVAET